MIFIKDNAVTVYGFFTNDGDGKTGLTVTFSCYEGTSGTPVVNAQSATELAGGFYYYTISSGTVDANAGYVYKFVTAGTVDQAEIPGQFVTASWAEKIDDGVTLADDAITAAKFDESTAYPLKSADTGATAVARTGADSDTLETLSDEIAAVASAVTTIDGIVDSIVEDTGTTLPATLTTIEGKIDTVDGVADSILEDTGTTIPGTITTLTSKVDVIDGIVDDILVDTGTTLDGKLDTIDGIVDEILVDTGTTIPAAISGLNDPTAAAIADAVWDESIIAHLGAGSTGASLNAAGSAGDPWTTELPGSYTGSQAGKIVADILTDTGTTLNDKIDVIDGIVDSIVADTDELQTNQGNWLTATGFSTHSAADVVSAMQVVAADFKADVSGLATAADLSVVDGIVDSILEDTGTTIPAQITGLNNVSTTDMQTAAAAALTAYDPPTNTELEARTLPAADYFDPSTDTVTLADGAHGGASATLTLSDYSDFVGAGSSLTAADIADAVWEELVADHSGTSGSTAEQLAAAGTAGDPWATAVPGSYTSGQAGYKLGVIHTALQTSNATITSAADASTLNIRRGDTLTASFTSLGTMTGYTKVWFTVKRNPDHADSEAEIQIDSATGLLYINGSAGTAAKGSITVSDASAGNLTVTLDESETAKLAIRGSMYYDVQMLLSGAVTTLASGRVNVIYDVTKATS